MNKDYLATQLLSGKDEAPGRTHWWPRHSKAMSKYVIAVCDGPLGSVPGHKNALMAGAEEWETLIYRAKLGLMCEHASLEAELVDAALQNDMVTLELVGEKLVVNARAQAESFRVTIPDFPSDRYHALLCEHVNLFIDSVQARLMEDEKAFHKAEDRRKGNSIALAGLSTEWL